MLQIYGNRDELFQWDVNQKVIADGLAIGDEIHCYNIKQSNALVTIAYMLDGVVVADIPNLLLQSSLPLSIYRYVSDEDGQYTIDEHTFNVKQRPKPADYVYAETEVLDYGTLDKRITELEKNGGGGGGSADVDLSDYYTSEVVDTLLAEKANASDVDDRIGEINEWLERHEETLNSHQEQIESKLDSTEFVDFQSYVNEELNDMNESIDGKVNSDEYSDNNEYVQGMLDTLNEQVQTKATMSDVEAYIEQTLLGGAW